MYYENLRFKEALECVNRALTISKTTSLLKRVGEIYYRLGKLEKAQDIFTSLLPSLRDDAEIQDIYVTFRS